MPSFIKKNKNIVTLFLLVFFQMVLISIQAPKGKERTYFETFIFAVFSPIQHGAVSLTRTISRVWNNYFYLREVKIQNTRLQTEVTQLRQENTILRNILEKYKKDKEVKEFLSDISENLVPGRIIGFDMTNVFKSVSINKGSRQGLKKDMVVLDDSGNLVGRIVYPISYYQATVQLITDSKAGVSVIKQEGSSIGILSGNNTEICDLNYILSTDEEVRKGDVLVTTGHDGIFPPGLRVGEVLSVEKTSDLFKSVKVRPYFRIDRLHQIVVIRANTNIVF